MKKITQEAQKLAEEGAPQFIKAVQQAANAHKAGREATPVIASLKEFVDDPMLLYACLWFAATQQVPVLFEAPQSTK